MYKREEREREREREKELSKDVKFHHVNVIQRKMKELPSRWICVFQ